MNVVAFNMLKNACITIFFALKDHKIRLTGCKNATVRFEKYMKYEILYSNKTKITDLGYPSYSIVLPKMCVICITL